jgi:hypothetical protein
MKKLLVMSLLAFAAYGFAHPIQAGAPAQTTTGQPQTTTGQAPGEQGAPQQKLSRLRPSCSSIQIRW